MCGKYVEQEVTSFGRELQADAAAEQTSPAMGRVIDLMAELRASLARVEGDVTRDYDDLTIVALRDVTGEPVLASTRFPEEVGTVPETTLLLVEPDTRKDVLGFAITAVISGPNARTLGVDTGLTVDQAEVLHSKIGTWIESQRGAPVGV